MGYLFLSVALICGSVKGYCGKKTSGIINSTKDAMTANLIRVVICAIIGFLMIAISNDLEFIIPSGEILLISLLSGIATSVFIISWLISAKTGAYMMLDVFLMASVILPIILGIFLFDEKVDLTDWIGIIILLTATLIMCSYNNSIKGKMSAKAAVLLIICSIACGICDFSQKLFVKNALGVPISVFNFYTYLFASITLIFALAVMGRKKERSFAKFELKSVFLYILIMAICLFAHSFFKTLAAKYLPSVGLYPLSQGASLILSSLMASILFKEKITLKCTIGIVLAFLGLILINVI